MCMLALKPSIHMPQSGNHRGEGLGKGLVGRRGTPKEGEVEHVFMERQRGNWNRIK